MTENRSEVVTLQDWKSLKDGSTVRVYDSTTPIACDLFVGADGVRHWFTTLDNRSDGNGFSDEVMHEVYGTGTVLASGPLPRPGESNEQIKENHRD